MEADEATMEAEADGLATALSRAGDIKARLAAADAMSAWVDARGGALADCAGAAHALAAAAAPVTRDANFRVAERALGTLTRVARHGGEDGAREVLRQAVKDIVERTGDSKAPVRDAAAAVLGECAEQLGAAAVCERACRHMFTHKNPRVRAACATLVRTLAETFGAGNAADGVVPAKAVVPELLKLLGDGQPAPREAAAECLEELYVHLGRPLADAVARSNARPAHKRELAARFERLAGAGGGGGGGYADGYAGAAAPTPERIGGIGVGVGAENSSPEDASRRARAAAAGHALSHASPAPPPALAAASAPAPARAPGGLLPPAEPRAVGSERELAAALDKCFREMLPSKDWNERIAAMSGVESLVTGGAAEEFPGALSEKLREHREVLVAQVADRRSAVMRQACHLIATAAHALAPVGGLDALADTLLAALGKCVVMTVAVMADSAHICAMALVAFCHPGRTVPRCARWASREKGATLRVRGAQYVAAALVRWAPAGDAACDAKVLGAALEAVRGAGSDEKDAKVRAGLRDIFGVVACAFPETAKEELENAGVALARQLARVEPQDAWARVGGALEEALGSGASGRVVGARSASSRAQGEWNQYVGKGAAHAHAHAATHGEARGRPASAHTGSHPSLLDEMPVGAGAGATGGLGAPARRTRPASAAPRAKSTVGVGNVGGGGGGAGAGPRRVLQPSQENRAVGAAAGGPGSARARLSKAAWGTEPVGSRNGPVEVADEADAEPEDEAPRALPAALSLAAAALGGASSWQARESVLATLRLSLERHPGGCSLASAERLAGCLESALQDAHSRVAVAALSVVSAAARRVALAMEPTLERVLPGVLARAADAKAPVAAAAGEALDALRSEYGGEALLPALLRALEAQRAPRARAATLEFALVALPRAPAPAGANLRQWASRVAPLAADRVPEVRRAAAAALVSVYESLDASALFGALVALPAAEQSTARRAVADYVPSLDAEIAVWARERSAGGHGAAVAAVAAARESYYGSDGGQYGGASGGTSHDQLEASAGVTEGYAAQHARAYASPVARAPSGADAGGHPAQGGSAGRASPYGRAGDAAGAGGAGGGAGDAFSKWTVPSDARPSSRYGGDVDDTFDDADNVAAAPSSPSPIQSSASKATPIGAPAAAEPASAGGDAAPANGGSPAGAVGAPSAPASAGTGAAAKGLPASAAASPTAASVAVAPSPMMPLTPPMPPLTPAAAGDTAATVASLSASLRAPEAAERAAALRRLDALLSARPAPRLAQRQASGLLLGAIEAACPESAPSERELALGLARDMLLEHGDVTSLHSAAADAATHRLLIACRDPLREVSRAAAECLEALLGRLPPQRALDTLLPIVAAGARGKNGGAPGPEGYGDGATSLQAAIKALARAVSRMRPDALMSRCAAVLPPLFEAFDSASADVRKAVVFALVDMWVVLGDALTPHLGALSTSQLKLVTIYVNKVRGRAAARASRRV